MSSPPHEEIDPVALVGRIAQALPAVAPSDLERLASALDELTEAVGLRMATGE